MSSSRLSASFRDPSGFLFRHEGRVYRQVSRSFAEGYERMMGSGFHRAAVEAGELIGHEEVSSDGLPVEGDVHKVLLPEQIPFVSYPYEWCFSQLKDAALLTLALQKRAVEHDLWLKDASAYNVQFLRGRPVFIDTLSFEPYPEGRPWVAYQQFCRHFLAPLALMAHTHIDLGKLMRVYVDSVPLELAARLLPRRTRLSISLGLHIHSHARAIRSGAGDEQAAARARAAKVSRNGLLGLISSLESAVRKLGWKPAGTEWGEYYAGTSYSDSALQAKRAAVGELIDTAAPEAVWDLGANTGWLSRVACERGLPVVAFDIDPAAVEKSYRQVREQGERSILPLVMDLTNPSPSLGWDFAERMSLAERGPVDLGLALALIHHLAISNNVPLDRCAAFFRGLCRSLVIEFVPKSDSQVARLLATREDVFPDYTQEGFERAFESCFTIARQVPVEGSERTLYLLEGR